MNSVWELVCAWMCEFSCKCQKNVVKCRYTFYLVVRWMWLIHNIRLCLQLFVISTHIIGNLQYTKYALLWTWISWMRDEMYTFTLVRVYKLVHLSKIYLRSLRKSFLCIIMKLLRIKCIVAQRIQNKYGWDAKIVKLFFGLS